MVLKVDPKKVKAAFKEQEEKAKNSKKQFDPKDSLLLKPVEEALKNLTQRFRALPYVHSENPEGDPFPIRGYHYLPGVGNFYCPKVNDAETCHVCEFVWSRMSECKGNKEAVKEWANYLPKLRMFIPGLARNREDEGVKFFAFTTYQDNPSKNHQKVMGWFFDEDYEDWLDPENGRDIKIKYEEVDEAKKKALNTKAKYFLEEFSLADKSSLSENATSDYEELLNNMPNIDEDLYERKTEDDSLEALEKWQKKLGSFSVKKGAEIEDKDSDDTEISGKAKNTEKKDNEQPDVADLDDLEGELKELGV